MTGRLRNLRSFWSDKGRPSTPWLESAVDVRVDPQIVDLAVRLAEVEEERDALAKGLIVAAERNHTLRRMLAASPDQAYRNCLALSDRNEELRKANRRLEREVARLRGRSTEPDWTGNTTLATRPS